MTSRKAGFDLPAIVRLRGTQARHLGNSLLTCDICCTYCTGVVLDHKGYNMKGAELFRNGQSKPEVLKESKE
jgi:hypothetical protein